MATCRRPLRLKSTGVRLTWQASEKNKINGFVDVQSMALFSRGDFVSPEAAGVSEADRRGLSAGAIDGWIAPDTFAGSLVVGGRNFDGAQPRLEIYVDDRLRDQAVVAPGFFLRFIPLESPSGDRADYAMLHARTIDPANVDAYFGTGNALSTAAGSMDSSTRSMSRHESLPTC